MGQDIDITNAREVLQIIAEMTDVDDPQSYRNDDPRGCLDTVHDLAQQCAAALAQ